MDELINLLAPAPAGTKTGDITLYQADNLDLVQLVLLTFS